MIEKARVSGVDGELQNILTKWEHQNNKIFEQYPEDRPNDLAILEQAIEEVHKPKAGASALRNKDKEDQRVNDLKEMEV